MTPSPILLLASITMSLPSLEEFAECLWGIEQELVRERQEKQNLEMRLENLMMMTEGLVADLPGAALGDTRIASSRLAKPAKLSEYNGDHVNGHTFFNSCTLYLGLCVNEFQDDQAQILSTLSFMKMGRAAFTLQVFGHASKTGVASRTGRILKRHSNISSFPYMNTPVPWIDWSHANTIRASIW